MDALQGGCGPTIHVPKNLGLDGVIILHQLLYVIRNLFHTHYLTDLRRPLGKSLGDPSMELSTLLGIREILYIGDLQFPILLNKSEDFERIVVELITVDSMKRD